MTAFEPPLPEVDTLLQQGLALQEQGRFAEAGALYEQVLAIQADHFDALHLLGVIAAQTDNPARAVVLMGKAIEVRPDQAPVYFNRGIALQQLQRPDEAVASFDQAIALQPNHAYAFFQRGLALQALHRTSEALASFEHTIAIKPDFAQAHANRGSALHLLKRAEEAVDSYARAISLKPDFAGAYCNRGIALQELRRSDEALASFDRALAIWPEYAQAHFNRGNALAELKRTEEALASFERAIAIQPDYANAHFNCGIALEALKRPEEAVASYQRAIAIQPNDANAHNNLGNALHALKRYDEAVASFERAIALKAEDAEVHFNQGISLKMLKRTVDAVASFDRAIAINPDFADPYWNKSLALLQLGHLEQAWALYEWRWRLKNSVKWRDLSQTKPLWLGESSLSGKLILLHAEQGLGDTIQFCRYARLVKALGATVLLEVPKPLMSLLSGLEGVDCLIEQGSPLPDFDYHCPLMSLPLAFKTRLDTIPNSEQYLFAQPEKSKVWQHKLGVKSRPRVGLVWSGGFLPSLSDGGWFNQRRNLPFELLGKLNGLDVDFVSLQKGEPAESELAAAVRAGWAGPAIADYGADLQDFSDTAALIENLDLVISVDTSVAHLAAALGKPVWILNRYDNCWRWLQDRSDSPWYPTVKLYNQARAGDWEEVLQRVKQDLVSITHDSHPQEVSALLQQGQALQQQGQFAAAHTLYQQVLAREPRNFDAHFNAGLALQDLRRTEEAIASYERAIAIQPDHAAAHSNRGIALHGLGRSEEALESFDLATAVNPGYAAGYCNRGTALHKLERYEEALASYERAISINPGDAEVYYKRAISLVALRRLEDALASYDKAIAINPHNPDSHWNKSLLLLSLGRLEEGWSLYQWRFKRNTHQNLGARYHLVQPPWLGHESLAGKTILLHAEQGLGDTIQFCRYAKLVKALGATVLLEVPRALRGLLSQLEGVDRLIERGAEAPAFDFHCPLMSLPLAFKTRLDTIPNSEQYLFAQPEKSKVWQHKLGVKSRPRVGLVWSGGFRAHQPEVWAVNERRNLPFELLGKLNGLDVDFVSLQKGEPAESQLAAAVRAGWSGPAIADYGTDLQDFSDTAALIDNLDLVISVDTSVAHLAAALGKPVWILTHFDNCWRWLQDRTDSPWYPTVRLYNQARARDWEEVLQRVEQDLAGLSST